MGQQGGQIGQQTGQIGQQTGGQQTGQTTGGQMPIQFEDALTPEMRQALEEFTKVEKVCEWAVEQSLGRGIPEAVRVLRDIADLAEVNERLLVRSSTVGPHVAEAFVKAASQALVELQQYSQPHIVQTTNVIARSLDSTQKLLTSIGWTGGQQTGQSGQQGTQFGQQGVEQYGQQGGQTPTYY